jgi:hypothetical protein
LSENREGWQKVAKIRKQKERTLTVRELAERVHRHDQDVDGLVIRLRNWTKEGFLTLSGDANPGTGRRRRYPSSAITEALLLNFLTDVVGIQTVKANALRKFLADVKSNPSILYPNIFPERDQFLVIGRSSSRSDFKTLPAARVMGYIQNSGMDAHIVISTASLNAPLVKE